MSKNEKIGISAMIILICVSICNMITAFQKTFPAVLGHDIQASFQVSTENIALISSYVLLAYAIAQIPTGLLTDKFGGKKILIVYQIICGLATLCFAFTPDFSVALYSRFIIGIAVASLVPAMKLVAANFSERNFAKASSVLMASGSIGGVLSTAPLVALNNMIGWRIIIAAAGFLILAIGIIIIFMPDKESKAQIHAAKKNKVSVIANLLLVLKTKAFWPVFFWYACTLGVLLAMSTFWFGHYAASLGFSMMELGQILFINAMLTIVFIPFATYIAEKVFHSYKKVLILSSLGVVLSILPFCFLTEINYYFFSFCLMIFSICGGCTVPLAYAICRGMFSTEIFGTVTGCLNTSGSLFAAPIQVIFGFILAYLASGEVQNSADFAKAFIFIVVLAAIALISALLIHEKK